MMNIIMQDESYIFDFIIVIPILVEKLQFNRNTKQNKTKKKPPKRL